MHPQAVAFRNKGLSLTLSLIFLCLGLIGTATATAATSDKLASATAFDIPSMPLSQALKVLADQAGVQILFEERVVQGHDAPAVKTRQSALQVLSMLLSNTDLEFTAKNETIAVRKKTTLATAGQNDSVSGEWQGVRAPEESAAKMSWFTRLARGSSNAAAESPTEGSTSDASKDEAGTREVQEIVVTAQRREERLLDTPISVGILSGDELDRSGVRGVSDALRQVGGVSVVETAPGYVRIGIRGILSAQGAATSAAAYYTDDVPFSLLNTGGLPDTNAFDLQRVEVLRGPQGTLYGANALAGVVRVFTNDADLDAFAAKGRLRGSNTEGAGENGSADLALNVPLIPGKLAIRGVAGSSRQSGYIATASNCFVNFGGCTPGREGINDLVAESYRLKAAYQPFDDLRVQFGYVHSNIENDADSVSLPNYTTRFSENRPADREYDQYSLVADYDAGRFSLISSTGYIDFTNNEIFELASGADKIPVIGINGLRSFTQELRIVSNLDGPWQWSGGAYYRDMTDALVNDPQAVITGNLVADYTSESYAVFGELTRVFADGRYELTGGLRYFQDEFQATQYSGFFGGALPPQSANFDKVTWRVLFNVQPAEDTMLYGSVATGFRSGRNQSFSALAVFPTLSAIDPDSLINYEVGGKGKLFGGNLTYDLAVYYLDWSDIQQTLRVAVNNREFAGYLNAGEAGGPGVDLGLMLRASDTLTLNTSIGWNDLRYDENVLQGVNVLYRSGERINESPAWTVSAGGELRIPTGYNDLDFVTAANASYTSVQTARTLSGNNAFLTESDPVTILTARVGVEGKRWTLSLFGENLLDEDGFVSPYSFDAGIGPHYRPRTIGLQLSVDY